MKLKINFLQFYWKKLDYNIYNHINKTLIKKKMDLILPCCRVFLQYFSSAKQLRKKQMFKRYSSIEDTATTEQKSIAELSVPIPNDYTGLEDAQIFITPSVDAETSQEATPGNLLINKCKGGSFVIMRSLQNVYIDSCSNCFVFIGPCKSTLFIRNCKNIKIRSISQQLRIQNSQNVMVQAIVGVKPVLEDCKSIKFSSLSCKMYEDLIWQIETANIDVFDNQVYECYDFTPKKYANFVNCENQQFAQQDAEWEAKIELNDLDWQYKNVYLPQIAMVKKSMLSKLYTQNELKLNDKIFIIFTKTNLKQMLSSLSEPTLSKNIYVIKRLPQQICLKVLKNDQSNKEKIQIMDQKQGKWYFLMMKSKNKINNYGIGLPIIEDKELIYKLFHLSVSNE